jgi:predicted nucleic acid-binding protein
MEILLGIELMPAGRRSDALRPEVEGILYEDFVGRILPFDSAAARFYAQIVASRRRQGRPISPPDAQIAAIARVHGYALAPRNINDFRDCGITLINPWEA